MPRDTGRAWRITKRILLGIRPEEPPARGAKARAWRLVRRVLFPLVRIYLALAVGLFLFQGCLLYHPSSDLQATPSDAGLEYEDVTLTAADGVRLSAWYVPARKPLGTVLFFHGNAGNMAGRLHFVRLYHGMGMNVLILDYRGYGRSEGRPGETGTYRDAEAAWRHLVGERGVPPEKILIAGRSLGGAVAVWLAARHEPGALVLESTFTSVADRARELLPIFPVDLMVRHRYESLERIGSVACPKLFVHGRDDRTIPIHHGRRLFEAASEPKAFLELEGGHEDAVLRSRRRYEQTLERFVQETLGRRAPGPVTGEDGRP